MASRVTVVIVNYNSGPWLGRCLACFMDCPDPPSCIVLDNASRDASADAAAEYPGVVRIDSGENLGFGPGVNRAAESVKTHCMLVLNPDCLIGPDGLVGLLEPLESDDGLAMTGGRVFEPDGTEQRASRRCLPTPGRIVNEFLPWRRRAGLGVDRTGTRPPEAPQDVEALSGACMMIRTEAFRQAGGFDADYPMHFEDLDLMARLLQAGWRLRLMPEIRVRHAGGVSSSHRRLRVLWAKHAGLWRYLSVHCRDRWPPWSRPVWALALLVHALIRSPAAVLRRPSP